tara:strand:+ start:4350 stop:4838 length:489 start_codon:yes stop_codon:yes gene_type:complete
MVKDKGQLTGKIDGSRLTMVRFSHRDKFGHRINVYRCDCGNYTKVYHQAVVQLNTKSCGCLQKEYQPIAYKRMLKYDKKRRENHLKSCKGRSPLNKGKKRVDVLVDGEIKHKFVAENEVAKYEKQFMRQLTALYHGLDGEVESLREREAPNKGKKFIGGHYV